MIGASVELVMLAAREVGAHRAELLRALRRLEGSGGRLARKRARRAFLSAARAVLDDYPLLGRDGAPVAGARAYACPIGCRMPPLGAAALARHLAEAHGAVLGSLSKRGAAARVAGLARAGKLETAAIRAASEAAFKGV